MWNSGSPGALAARFARLVEQLGGDTAAAKAMGQTRDLLQAVASQEPATLNEVAVRVKRGAQNDAVVRGNFDGMGDPVDTAIAAQLP